MSKKTDCSITGATMDELEKLINGSDLNFEDLIDHVHASLTYAFAPGDKVQLMDKRHGHAGDGEVIGKTRSFLELKDSTPTKRPESVGGLTPLKHMRSNYDVKVNTGIIYSVPSEDLLRCVSDFPSKADLRSFLQENAKFTSQRWKLEPKIGVRNVVSADATSTEAGRTTKRKLLINLEPCKLSPSTSQPKKIKATEPNEDKTNGALVESPLSSMRKPEVVLERIDGSMSPPVSPIKKHFTPKKTLQVNLTNGPSSSSARKKLNARNASSFERASPSYSINEPEVLLVRVNGQTPPVRPSLEKHDCASKRKLEMNSETNSASQKNTPVREKTSSSKSVTPVKSSGTPTKVPQVVLMRIDPGSASLGSVKKLRQTSLLEMMLNMPAKSTVNPILSAKPPLPCTNNNNIATFTTGASNAELINPAADPVLPRKRVKNVITPRWAILHGAPLPVPQEISIPSGFPKSVLGDCFFIAEFIGCHAELLRPGTNTTFFPPKADQLLEVLALGPQSFNYFNNVLACLLRVLIKDTNWAKELQIVKTDISKLTLSVYVASELARLVLKKAPALEMEAKVSEALIALETQDVCELDAVQKVSVLVALCHLVLDSEAAIDYRERKLNDAAQARRQIAEIKLEEASEKLNKENLESDVANNSEPVSTKDFYGGAPDGVNVEKNEKSTIVVQQRIRDQAIKATKEKQLRDKLLQAKRIADEKQERTLNKLERLDNLGKLLFRIDPLGIDRHGSRYWMLENSGYGLIVERLTVANSDNRANNSDKNDSEESFISSWCHYNTEDQINFLKSCLCTSFLPEKKMAAQLRKPSEFLDNCSRPGSVKVEPNDGTLDLIETLREEISNLEESLFNGSLALIADRDKWLNEMKNAQSCVDFASCLLKLYSDIPLNILSGSAWNERSGDAVWTALSASELIDDEFSGEFLIGVTSMSRLHLFIEILSLAIKWDLEVRLSRCHVCHTLKKKFFVTCGWCRTVFHAECISPPLQKLPRDTLWFCSPCETNHDASKAPPEIDDMPTCCNRRSRDEIVACSSCHKVYHKKCHQPPLRNTPRGDWNCSNCDQRKKRVNT